MKGSKLVLSFWLATAAFCLLQILFGPGGLSETAHLKDQQVRLEARLVALKDENRRLTARYEALRTSQDAVRLEARSLGWFQPGETPVRTLGGAEFRLPSDEPDLSTVPPLGTDPGASSLFFRLAWSLLFVLFSAFFHLWNRMWPRADQPSVRVPLPRLSLPAPLQNRLQTGLDFFRK